MKRRRRGLGSSAAVHAVRGEAARSRIRDNARDVIRLAEDGACEMAFGHLTGMHIQHGEALAHGSNAREEGSLMIKARHVFRRNCVK